jgi:hypothetical protein
MTNLNQNSSNSQNQIKTNEEIQTRTEIKLKNQNQTLGIDVNAFKQRLLKDLDEISIRYRILNNISALTLFNADYSLVDRLKAKGDVNLCPLCNELYIQNPCGCYHCQTECAYC